MAEESGNARRRTGILPYQDIAAMVRGGGIASCAPDRLAAQIQPASIDLSLGRYAYPVEASFLPGPRLSVHEKMRLLDESFETFRIDLRRAGVLEKGRVYVIELCETLDLNKDVAGFANPKSSTGRLDILTRLITDYATAFDQVEKGYAGKLYLEVAPRTFSIVAKTGAPLNQLRFRRSRTSPQPIGGGEWRRLLEERQIIRLEGEDDDREPEAAGMLRFTVDLRGGGEEGALIGYRAKRHSRRIDLERRDYDPRHFWEPIRYHASTGPSLVLDPDEFYILMTREPVGVPPDYAAEMLPYDTRAGEFRVHYAGFFDPGFGWDCATRQAGSSRGVLEVRSHDVPFLLEHGQTVGWLRYERMAQRPARLYGDGIGSHYQHQGLKLAKQFASP